MAPSIAVLGGGISGLSAAFHLLRRLPSASVTLFEGAETVGGWMGYSESTMLRDTRITLEPGPRTLRPKPALCELIDAVNIVHMVAPVPESLPRFVRIPSPKFPGLTLVPDTPNELYRSPLFWPVVRAAWHAFRSDLVIPEPDQDESLEDFAVRHVGEELGRMGASAGAHGIFAADSRVLSARAVLGRGYQLGSPVVALLTHPPPKKPGVAGEYQWNREARGPPPTRPFSLREGTSALPLAVQESLLKNKGFTLRTSTHVTRLNGTDVTLSDGTTTRFDRVVSALPLYTLRAILPPAFVRTSPSVSVFLDTPYASVTVVNLVFDRASCPYPAGFGYLHARLTADGPMPDVLGVIFDSSVAPESNTVENAFMRCTAMLSRPLDLDELMRQLSEHVGVQMPFPVLAKATQANRCIPTPTVSHVARVSAFKSAVKAEWKGDVEVIGAALAPGPGIGDCIEEARNVGADWTDKPNV